MSLTVSSPVAAPAVVRAGALESSIKVEPLTCAIGAELHDVNLGDASRDDALFAAIKALLLEHKVLFLREPGHHARRARRLRASLRRARGSPGDGERPQPSRARAHLQGSGHPRGAVRERLSLRHDLARVPAVRGGAALYRGARGRRRHDLVQHGPRIRAAARAGQAADRRLARPAQHRGDASAQRCRSRSASR